MKRLISLILAVLLAILACMWIDLIIHKGPDLVKIVMLAASAITAIWNFNTYVREKA